MSTRATPAAKKAHALRERQRTQRTELAIRLASQLAVEGRCATPGTHWNAAELLHQEATTQKLAQWAADMVLGYCAECPVIALCHRWATVDNYTGLAAGQAWVNGEPHAPRSTRYQPVPSEREAS